MADSFTVCAIFRARPGSADAAEPYLSRYAEKAHEEPGCQLYSLQRETTDSGVFVVIEKWESEGVFEEHLRGDGEVFAIWDELRPLLTGDPEVIRTQVLEAGQPTKYRY